MHPLVALLRRFAVDFFDGNDTSVCSEIMDAEYVLRIGDALISGRDEHYVPAVRSQFEQFHGLSMTVHEVVTDGERIALSFTEHGASGGRDGRTAAWSGVSLYRWNGVRLTSCWAEEDYVARRRQLKSGVPDRVERPHDAPWDTTPGRPDPEAEAVVRRWLEAGEPTPGSDVIVDDERHHDGGRLMVEVMSTTIDEMFSAGDTVAFHATQDVRSLAGFAEAEQPVDGLTLFSAGVVRVAEHRVCGGRVVRDRAGLQRSLATRATSG